MRELTPWNSHEKIEKYEALFPVLPDFVAHHTIKGKFGPKIGLPDSFSLNLAEDIFAVLTAHQMDLSIDYAKKRYGIEIAHSRWLGLTERIDQIYRLGRDGLGYYSSFSMDQPRRDGSFDELAIQFFYRNLASFDAAKRLSELGYLCEVSAVLRSALEQFAFVAELRTLIGTEKFEKIKPNNSVGWLSKRMPGVGRLYGTLSKYVHFEFDHHSHFLASSEKQTLTLQRSPVLRAYSTHLLFVTMVCLSRYLLQISPAQFGVVPDSVKSLAGFVSEVERFSTEVRGFLPSDGPLASMDKLLLEFESR